MPSRQPRYKMIMGTDGMLASNLEMQIQALSQDGWRVHTIDLHGKEALKEKWADAPTEEEE